MHVQYGLHGFNTAVEGQGKTVFARCGSVPYINADFRTTAQNPKSRKTKEKQKSKNAKSKNQKNAKTSIYNLTICRTLQNQPYRTLNTCAFMPAKTFQYSLLVSLVKNSLFILHSLHFHQLTDHRSIDRSLDCNSVVVRRSSFVVRRSSFVVCRSSFVVRRSSFVVRRSSFDVSR